MLTLTNRLLQQRGGNLSSGERSGSRRYSPLPASPRGRRHPGLLEPRSGGRQSVSLGWDVGLPRVAAPRPVAMRRDGLDIAPVSAGLWISSPTASPKLFPPVTPLLPLL